MATKIETATMYTAAGGSRIAVTRHATYQSALRSMTAAQRKLYSATVWALPGGGYDLFPLGHPVPAGAHLTYGPAWQDRTRGRRATMEFTMTVSLDNDAFGDNRHQQARELASVLYKVRHEVAVEHTSGTIADSNGNRVGSWEIK